MQNSLQNFDSCLQELNFLQVQHGYRFSSDALLLAYFSYLDFSQKYAHKKHHSPLFILDLGCGCGVIGLAFLYYMRKYQAQLFEHIHIVALDKEQEHIEIAKQNAKIFHLDKHFSVLQLDISEKESLKTLQDFSFSLRSKYLQESQEKKKDNQGISKNPRLFQAVLSNPPWYIQGQGQETSEKLRKSALMADLDALPLFFHFAEKVLIKNACLYTVGKAGHFQRYLRAFAQNSPLVTMQNVHKDLESHAIFVLLISQYQSKKDTCILPSFYLNPPL